ncbi:AbiH family protein [Chryseobacterium sp. KACC 21268]|nr:AbiH family protein [Chryseobacterium sp. KACC 21268]
MNRLIIVGNGFDLAHGLPTSYANFVDFIWQNFNLHETNELFNKLFIVDYDLFGRTNVIGNYNNLKQIIEKAFSRNSDFIISTTKATGYSVVYRKNFNLGNDKIIFEFKNKFFYLINSNRINNWVQIEDLYYKELLTLVKNLDNNRMIKDINQLNREFEEIKLLLNFYLKTEIEDTFDFNSNISQLSEIAKILEFKFQELKRNSMSSYFHEFTGIDKKMLINYDNMIKQSNEQYEPIEFENLFVDFNYTSTVGSYVRALNQSPNKYGKNYHIQIHGNLTDLENPINFGFGDEMDDHYKIIENNNNNAYLENMKSFMYLNNSNYKDLLNWIREKDYQILIFGHSCGLSDRTLLNTVFENENCKSIKIFYHKRNNGPDNFRNLSMDISRHFNKKPQMRDKVVNKSLCQELPQNIRFQKKIIK